MFAYTAVVSVRGMCASLRRSQANTYIAMSSLVLQMRREVALCKGLPRFDAYADPKVGHAEHLVQ